MADVKCWDWCPNCNKPEGKAFFVHTRAEFERSMAGAMNHNNIICQTCHTSCVTYHAHNEEIFGTLPIREAPEGMVAPVESMEEYESDLSVLSGISDDPLPPDNTEPFDDYPSELFDVSGANPIPQHGLVPDGQNYEKWKKQVKKYLVNDWMVSDVAPILEEEEPFKRLYERKCSSGEAAYWIYRMFE